MVENDLARIRRFNVLRVESSQLRERESVIGVETVTSAFARCGRFLVVNYLLIRMLNRKLAQPNHQQQLPEDKAENTRKKTYKRAKKKRIK